MNIWLGCGNWCGLLRLILLQHYTQFPDSSLPLDIYGPLEVKLIVNGSVGIGPELWWVHQGTDTTAAIRSGNWGDVGGDVLKGGFHFLEAGLGWSIKGWSETSDFWGGDVMTATVVIFPGEECLDSQLDASVIAQSRRSLTCVVILPSNFGGDLCGLVIRMVVTLPIGGALVSGSSMEGILILRYRCLLAIMLILLLSGSGRVVIMGSSCPFKPMG